MDRAAARAEAWDGLVERLGGYGKTASRLQVHERTVRRWRDDDREPSNPAKRCVNLLARGEGVQPPYPEELEEGPLLTVECMCGQDCAKSPHPGSFWGVCRNSTLFLYPTQGPEPAGTTLRITIELAENAFCNQESGEFPIPHA